MKANVLVIEDDFSSYTIIQKILERCKEGEFPFVSNAPTLRRGMKDLSSGSYDAVVLDLNLPDSTGLETLKALKAVYPAIPIIVCSGEGEMETALESVRLGAETFLVKTSCAMLPRIILYAVERAKLKADLTDACEQLKQSNLYLQSLLDHTPDWVCRYDPDGIVTYANKTACEAMEVECYEILGRPIYDFIDPAYHEIARQHQEMVTPENPVVRGSEIRHGKYWVQWQKIGIFDEDGNLLETQAIGKDVTYTVQFLVDTAHEAKRESERLSKELARQNRETKAILAKIEESLKDMPRA